MSERNWNDWAVWTRGDRISICHAADGDDCVGPFPTVEDAEAALNALRNRRPVPVEMEADTRRLDWLEEHQPDVLWAMASEPFMVYLDEPGPEYARPTLRECIDAAINQQSNEVSE